MHKRTEMIIKKSDVVTLNTKKYCKISYVINI